MLRVGAAILSCAFLTACLLDAITVGPSTREPVYVDTTSVAVTTFGPVPFAARVTFFSTFGSCGPRAAGTEIVMRSPLHAEVTAFVMKPTQGVCAGFIANSLQTIVVPFQSPGLATIDLIAGADTVRRQVELKP
jgi:hypothetical protein